MIEVQSIGKNFGPIVALKNISFQVARGQIVGILGPNGAGKTSLMRVLAGYFPPSSGRVLIDGIDLVKNMREVQKKIGYLPESAPVYGELTPLEALRFSAEMRKIPKAQVTKSVERAMDSCGLHAVANRLTGTLSKGFKQRVALASALVGSPDILILDEPTSGLDPEQIVEIRELVRDLGGEHTVLLSTHILSEVNKLTDRVLILFEGKLVADDFLGQLKTKLDLTKPETSLEDLYLKAVRDEMRGSASSATRPACSGKA